MSFPAAVADEALVKCGRCCCICHSFCGTKIELHHIKQKAYGGEDTLENCIPLCFNCHSDMGKADPKHPKGKHYSEAELTMHRDNWYKKVANGFTLEVTHVSIEDETLFNKICNYFSGKVEYLLRDHPISQTYYWSSIEPLEELLFLFQSPTNEFLNIELEKIRADLEEQIRFFINTLATLTYPIGCDMPKQNASHLWLCDTGRIDAEWGSARYQQFEEEADKIEKSAKELWEGYCTFVRSGRRILSNKSET